MTYNLKIHYIPALPPQREIRVGIYSRVSSNSMDQLNSLTSQISGLTRMVASVPKQLLVDVYIDIASSKTGTSRKEFNRMLEDCKSKNLEIIFDGELIINEEEAKNIRSIFSLYLQGKSIIGIIKELENRGIKTPTGKDTWSKRTIDVMLSNEKYIGVVRLLDRVEHEAHYVSENNHPPIISKEKFQAVQTEKINRSNVVKREGGIKRKDTKYSSKKK